MARMVRQFRVRQGCEWVDWALRLGICVSQSLCSSQRAVRFNSTLRCPHATSSDALGAHSQSWLSLHHAADLSLHCTITAQYTRPRRWAGCCVPRQSWHAQTARCGHRTPAGTGAEQLLRLYLPTARLQMVRRLQTWRLPLPNPSQELAGRAPPRADTQGKCGSVWKCKRGRYEPFVSVARQTLSR